MASTFIRAFAIMLALTGFSATNYNGGSSSGNSGSVSTMDDGSGSPVPVCLPSDPTYCGLR